MRAATILLVLFIVLTAIFASISAFEYQKAPATYTTTITTQLGTGQTSLTSASNPFPDNGYISIGGVGYFSYMKVPTSAGQPTVSTETLQNTTFTYLVPTATTTGAVCLAFKVAFQDGSSENLTACSYPTNFETSLVFSKHIKPIAGLMFIPSGGSTIYILVSM